MSLRPGVTLLCGLIRAYQWVVSPFLAPACRFYPSCSAYGIEAVTRHGVLKGGRLTLTRIARCHPWHPGGLDPVPPVASPQPPSVGNHARLP